MTLELKQYPNQINQQYQKSYFLGGVQEITNQTEYGPGYFAITIFDRRIFVTCDFEYIKEKGRERYFIKNGKWVENEEEYHETDPV